jgi:hypothetical protein
MSDDEVGGDEDGEPPVADHARRILTVSSATLVTRS